VLEHLNIHIRGKVQGVFYRARTKEKAELLGLKGFIRNERDGSVYLEAEGTSEQLEHLLTWCRRGPTQARVDQVISSPGEMQGFKTFEIKRDL
jgi:acylphosphatase